MKCITYGLGNKLDKLKILPVENSWEYIINKPKKGGLWASPIGCTYGWKEWCEEQDFRLSALEESITFEFTGKILTIDDLATLESLPFINIEVGSYSRPNLDFEVIAKEYDAIYLTEKGEQETRLTSPFTLYGWDCECLLVLNKKGIFSE